MDSKAWQLRLDESDKRFSVEGLEGWDQDLMYAKRSGVFQALSGMLCIDLTRAETDLEDANRKLKHSIHREDVVRLLGEFAATSDKEARMWMTGEGYFSDEMPMDPDTEATVGPITDHGCPFETGIPR